MNDQSTYQDVDPLRHTMAQVYEKFNLQEATIDFIGHAIALQPNDDYLQKACGVTIERCKLYLDSLMQYGGSPFIYPIYGLGGLPEGFSRLAAIHRGTYMLHKNIDGFVYDNDGKVCGVKSGDEVAKCKMVICDPSYCEPAKVQATCKIIRAICILGAPIPETKNSAGGPALSVQIICTAKQMKRKNDIYVMMVSWAHCIAGKDKYVAIVSTVCETNAPEKEIQSAVDLLGPVLHKFVQVSDYYVPLQEPTDNVFITTSYDPTSHFEDASQEVMVMWKRITGEDLDLTVVPGEEDE